MTLIRWEPFRELDDIFTRYSPLLGRLADRGTNGASTAWTPAANVSETGTEYLIKAELPEVSKDDVKVTVDENVITIRGERRRDAEQQDQKVHRAESFYGSFSRSFRLPEDADIASIRAESRDGMLKVRVPKTPAPKPRTVEVRVD